ncbi:MAG: MMPL family transporter, partial [Bacteroidota bacterium]
MSSTRRKWLLLLFSFLAAGSVYFAFQLKFSFDFEQFFPVGDPDLEFFLEFREKFETDDNFLMVALPGDPTVFNQDYLERLHQLKIDSRRLPSVTESVTITSLQLPVKLPLMGYTTVPAVHRKEPSKYARDSMRLVNDPRFQGNLISKDGKTAVLFIKTVDNLQQDAAEALMPALRTALTSNGFTDYHVLGRAFFQEQLVAMQKREMIVSTIVSGLLVTLIMFLIFRRFWGIVISLVSIGLGMLLFIGFLGLTGRELNAMSALYPVLMIIVGTSDVIHIMSKYIDELRKGQEKQEAIRITIREIGLATFLTSVTTAIGFATLQASRIPPIREFGLNAGIGVIIAYLTVLGFTTALLSWFSADKIIKLGRTQTFWDYYLGKMNQFTKNRPRQILLGGILLVVISGIGISKISTNYKIENNLPIGEKITEDFKYFEKYFSGFRPFGLAAHLEVGRPFVRCGVKVPDHGHGHDVILVLKFD